jgi:hypothetical protein
VLAAIVLGTAALLLGALSSAPAAGLSKPVAAVEPATAIHTTSAKLHGTVDPNGLPTTYHFQYGKGTAFAHSTAVVVAGSESSPVDVSAVVHHLKPGATYSFRLVATNSLGTDTSGSRSFTTLDPRLAGRFKTLVKVRRGGAVFRQRPGEAHTREYRLKTSCKGSRCQTLHIYRQGQRGHFRATLDRKASGVYQGIERFRGGYCDNGLRFKSRTRIRLRVVGTDGDAGTRVSGKLRPKVRGCVSGTERASFVGQHR